MEALFLKELVKELVMLINKITTVQTGSMTPLADENCGNGRGLESGRISYGIGEGEGATSIFSNTKGSTDCIGKGHARE